MKRLGVERIDQLIDERENDLVRHRVHGVPFAAIHAFIVRKCAGRQVELGIFCQQWKSIFGPRLMTEAHELRYELDAIRTAGVEKTRSADFGDLLLALTKFGVRLELEAVIDLEDQAVDAEFGK